MPEDPYMTRFFAFVNLERGLLLSLGALLIGVVLLLTAVNQWRLADFGRLDYAQTMRLVIPGATLSALGFQKQCCRVSSAAFWVCAGDESNRTLAWSRYP